MSPESSTPKIVVVGAGWAGLGATYHLAQQGYDVTLLEAPLSGWLSCRVENRRRAFRRSRHSWLLVSLQKHLFLSQGIRTRSLHALDSFLSVFTGRIGSRIADFSGRTDPSHTVRNLSLHAI